MLTFVCLVEVLDCNNCCAVLLSDVVHAPRYSKRLQVIEVILFHSNILSCSISPYVSGHIHVLRCLLLHCQSHLLCLFLEFYKGFLYANCISFHKPGPLSLKIIIVKSIRLIIFSKGMLNRTGHSVFTVSVYSFYFTVLIHSFNAFYSYAG